MAKTMQEHSRMDLAMPRDDPFVKSAVLSVDPQLPECNCRFCGTPLRHTFADLGMTPLANAYLKPSQANRMEPFYPLHAWVCERCYLVQLEVYETPDHIFSDYAYFSSYSDTWLRHAESFARQAMDRFGLGRDSQVIEIASNDGYLLQFFAKAEVPVLGIEPAANVAEVAIRKGIPTLVEFFGQHMARRLAAEGTQADLLVGNNVLAHVPDLNDFVAGMKALLKPAGVITMEFHHLLSLMVNRQFDTIYHEHFQYFSFTTARRVFARHGLTLFDVDELPIHGGSLRIYARHTEDTSRPVSRRVTDLLAKEESAGLTRLSHYLSFARKVKEMKMGLLSFLVDAKAQGKSVVCYGAAAKGNTLLNYSGVRTDFIDYAVDRNPHKQGLYLPGTHIPICHPDKVKVTRPDYLLILPWNIRDEIMKQMACIREWGGQFVVPIPELKVYA